LTTSVGAAYKRPLADERPTNPGSRRAGDPDREVEDLSRRIAEVVNSAGPEIRGDLREYAIELLKEETEQSDVAHQPAQSATLPEFNPLAIALLLLLAALPLLLSIVFAPVGLAVLVIAAIMGIWGVVATMFRRRA
jgi:VIT1/CCC1 family predicted Fe2+/Mn2+ transporter